MFARPLAFVVLLLLFSLACRHKNAAVVPLAGSENEYMDLKAGQRLSVTLPYLANGGGYVSKFEPVQEQGTTITMSAPDLKGFQVSYFAVKPAKNGRVRLRFQSAETTRDGKMSLERKPPQLPFVLPRDAEFIRLIYLVRSGAADHNMAIAASKDSPALDAFTKRLRTNPKLCTNASGVSCVWVPPGVAVRAE